MLKEKGLLDVQITKKAGYEFGVAQPAILVQKGRGAGEGEILFDWAIVPRTVSCDFVLFSENGYNGLVGFVADSLLQMNLGGAKDRPDLKQIWDNVQAKLQGKPVVHAQYSLTSFTGMIWSKIFG